MWGLNWALILGICCCSLAIILGHHYLPMNDAPSHIANAVITAGLWRGDSFFAAHYQVLPVAVPYWATALMMYPLQLGLPPLSAFSVVVALYALLLPLGFAAVVRRTAPENLPLCAVAALLAFNWAYFEGEANFILSQPLALLAYAAYLRADRLRGWAFAAFVPLSTAVYLSHVYALTALCGAIGLDLLWRSFATDRKDAPRVGPAQVACAAIAAMLFFTAVYFVFLQHHTGSNHGSLHFDFSPRKIAHMIIDPLDSPAAPSRAGLVMLALGLLGVLVLPWLPAFWADPRQTLQQMINRPLFLPAMALLLIAYLGPVSLLNGDGTEKEGEISMRFVLLGWLLLLGGVRLRPGRGPRVALLCVMLLLTGFKMQDTIRLHRSFDRRAREVTAMLEQVPEKSRLLPLMDMQDARLPDYLYHRLGNYVVVTRHGYSPHVFAVLGQQPLRHRRWGDYRQVDNLQVRQEEWAYYDYLLVQTNRKQPAIAGLADHAVLLARTGDFRLYRVLGRMLDRDVR